MFSATTRPWLRVTSTDSLIGSDHPPNGEYSTPVASRNRSDAGSTNEHCEPWQVTALTCSKTVRGPSTPLPTVPDRQARLLLVTED
jgi:hypothetical protein